MWIEQSKQRVVSHEQELAKLNAIPPLDHLTPEEYNQFFPGTYRDQKTDPYFIMEDSPDHDEIVQKYQSDFEFKLSSEEEEGGGH